MPPARFNRVGIGRNPPMEIQRKLELRKEFKYKIRQLQSEYQQRWDGYEIIDAKLQQYAASIAPITTIPNEMLSEVFQHVIEEAWLGRNKRDLAMLTSVCKHWREVAVNNPLLWNRIDVRMYEKPIKTYKQLDYVDLFLERSKSSLLEINISFSLWWNWHHEWTTEETHKLVERHFSHPSNPAVGRAMELWINEHLDSAPRPYTYPDVLTQILNQLTGIGGENMYRWRSLYLALDKEQLDYHWSLFDGPTPNLEFLYIEVDHGVDPQDDRLPSEKVIARSFPSLQSVKTLTLYCDISLSSFKVNAETLTSLDVWETPHWNTLELLPNFINLRKLAYRTKLTVHVPPSQRFIDALPVKIHLPLLKTLELSGYHNPLVFWVFDVPNISTLDIHAYIGSTSVRPIGRMFRHPSKITLYWPPLDIVSEADSVRLIKELLMQCSSLVILDAEGSGKWAKSSVLQAVQECRATPHGLSNLRKVVFEQEDVVAYQPRTTSELALTTTSNCHAYTM